MDLLFVVCFFLCAMVVLRGVEGQALDLCQDEACCIACCEAADIEFVDNDGDVIHEAFDENNACEVACAEITQQGAVDCTDLDFNNFFLMVFKCSHVLPGNPSLAQTIEYSPLMQTEDRLIFVAWQIMSCSLMLPLKSAW